jgi:hypothetical protein
VTRLRRSTTIVIPGHREAMSPKSITTAGSFDVMGRSQ